MNSKSEDELLAKAVPDLDLIISGHTHSELQDGNPATEIPILYPVVNTEEISALFR